MGIYSRGFVCVSTFTQVAACMNGTLNALLCECHVNAHFHLKYEQALQGEATAATARVGINAFC